MMWEQSIWDDWGCWLLSVSSLSPDGLGYWVWHHHAKIRLLFLGLCALLLQWSASSNLEKSSNYSLFYSVHYHDGGLTGGVFGIYAFAKVKAQSSRKIGGVLVLWTVLQILILVFNFSYDGLQLIWLPPVFCFSSWPLSVVKRGQYWKSILLVYPLHLLALSLFSALSAISNA